VTIPGSVTTIGDNAFRDCSSLTSVTMLGSNTTIIGNNLMALGNNAFREAYFVGHLVGTYTGTYNGSWARLSSDATLTSTIGTVDSSAGTIVAIPNGTTLVAFKAAIAPAAGATFEVYNADGTTVATDLASGYKVIVTAKDGTTTKTYTVTVNTLAVGTAVAAVDTKTITYTLTTGTFDAVAGIDITHWTLGGTDVANITPITTGGVALDVARKVATITVTNVIVDARNYTIAPAQDAFSAGFTAPVAATVSFRALAIGDHYQGGIVAYIFQSGIDSGYVAGQVHGLIAATADQSSGIVWAAVYQSTSVVGTLTTLGSGSANTDKIITQQTNAGITDKTTYAAGLAQVYNGGGYTDWYLPSKDELAKLYVMKVAGFGNFASAFYWSSTEDNYTFAKEQHFDSSGDQSAFLKNDTTPFVRAVRTF